MELTPGSFLGSYEIKHRLGVGGMGEVYFARDNKLGRFVAIKILRPEVTGNEDRLRRFKQEARATSALNHPNILTIFEIGEIDSMQFIVSEFIDGLTLREYFRKQNPSIDQMLDISIQVAGALAAAHGSGIIHRDIKPENIMRRADGYVKVLDFGLAKLLPAFSQETADTDLETALNFNTDPGAVVGTVNYMSPEQLRGLDIDGQADIWSLGVVMYEMIAGQPPFGGSTKSDMIAAILREDAPPLTHFAVPPQLHHLIEKCLRKEREDRYQTARDLLIDLRDLKQDRAVDVRLGRIQAGSSGAQSFGGPTSSSASEARTERMATSKAEAARPTSAVDSLINEIKRHKIGAGILLSLLGAGLLFAGLWFGLKGFWPRKPAQGSQSPQFTEIMTTSNVREAAISPDGKYIAAVVNDAGRQGITVQQSMNPTQAPTIVSGLNDYRGLVFSRDGYSIYYLGRDDQTQALYQVALLGGSPRKLVEQISTPVGLSPDGTQIAFIRRKTNGTILMVANADGTGERELASKPANFEFATFTSLNSGPVWSPDGKVIACPTMSSGPSFYMEVVAITVADGSLKPIGLRRWFLIGQLGWLQNGTGLVMDAEEKMPPQSTPQIWLLDYPSGEARALTSDLSYYHGISLTADTSTLITTRSDQTSQIWVLDLETNKAQTIPATRNKGSGGLAWAQDGRIFYGSTETGVQEIWSMEADGARSKQLTFDKRTNVEPVPTKLGDRVVYVAYATGQPRIWRMDSDGTNLKQLTNGNYEDWPSCSPDGQWVIYHAVDSSVDHIWKTSIEGGHATLITDKPAKHPVFSPDGSQIACFLRDDGSSWKLAVLSSHNGQIEKSFEVPSYVSSQSQGPRWVPDGKALSYIMTRGGISNISIQPLTGGPPRQLTNFEQDEIFGFAWSPDGKKLACVRGSKTRTALLIRNLLARD